MKIIMTIGFCSMTVVPSVLMAQGNKGIPDYSMTDRKDIPVEYTWKIEDIYADKAAWETDREELKLLIGKIEQTAQGWTSSAGKMMEFLNLMYDVYAKGILLYSYSVRQADVDMGNTEYQQMKGEIRSMFVQIGSKVSFYNTDILNLGEDKFAGYMKSNPELEPYWFTVYSICFSKDHILPPDEQKIVSLTGLYSGSMNEASSMLNNLDVPNVTVTLTNGEEVVLNYSNYMFYRGSKVSADRTIVMTEFWKNQKQFENTQAVLLNGQIKQHYFSAQVSNFDDCLSARLFGDNIPLTVYTNLIDQVRNHVNSLQRFIKIKQKLLKLEQFRYEDIYASAVPSVEKVYTYDEAKKLILESMKPMGKEYTDILEMAFNNRWIDIYPNKGKESGAYSSGLYSVHPYIKLNYNGEYDAVSTLTHELGHALHSWFSAKKQHSQNADYPTFLAEIASTFNENMLMRYLLKTEKDDLFKLFILDKYLDAVRGTIYRQTLFAEFELAMHKRAESGQSLTADWLDEEYLRITRDYYGHDKDVCYVGDYIQCEWSRIPHFYMNYYVFQYSTGLIASLALSDLVLNGGEKEQKAYMEMLSSGGNGWPIDLLKKAGVDMTSPGPYNAAFRQFDQMLDEMDQIVARLEKAGKL